MYRVDADDARRKDFAEFRALEEGYAEWGRLYPYGQDVQDGCA